MFNQFFEPPDIDFQKPSVKDKGGNGDGVQATATPIDVGIQHFASAGF